MEEVQMLLQIKTSCENAPILPLIITLLISSWEEKKDEHLDNLNLLYEGKVPKTLEVF